MFDIERIRRLSAHPSLVLQLWPTAAEVEVLWESDGAATYAAIVRTIIDAEDLTHVATHIDAHSCWGIGVLRIAIMEDHDVPPAHFVKVDALTTGRIVSIE